MSLKCSFLKPVPLYIPPTALKMENSRVPLHPQNPPIIFDLYAFLVSAALAFPAALPGDPHHRQCKQDSQHQQCDDTAYSYHKKDLSFERIPTPVYTICPRRATGKRCRLKLFSKNDNLGLHLDQRSGIINTFRFGGLAQLVRAPASHAGGLGFESLILHSKIRCQMTTDFFCLSASCLPAEKTVQ